MPPPSSADGRRWRAGQASRVSTSLQRRATCSAPVLAPNYSLFVDFTITDPVNGKQDDGGAGLSTYANKPIDFTSFEEGLPALLTLTVMPMTYSITNGIGAGFVLYVFIKLVTGKAHAVHPLLYTVSAAFVLYFSLGFLRATFGI